VHELTATQRILDAALERGGAEDGRRVRAVRLQLGILSGLTEDSIRFYWEVLTPGTAAEGSTLDVAMIPGRVSCRTCGADNEVLESYPMCPACAGVDLAVLAGDSCVIESVDTAMPAAEVGAGDGSGNAHGEVATAHT
jgi:hydrogenase nickel incorporation protein HypA/HybF